MRIAVFIKSTTFHKGYGGLETQNKVLCEGLAKKGHDVVVFAPQRELGKTQLRESGVTYVFVPCTFRYLFAALDKNSWYNRSVGTFVVQPKFDVVLSQSTGGLGVIKHKKELQIKVISIAHGSILSEFKSSLRQVGTIKSFIKLALNLQYVLRSYFGSQREYVNYSNKVVAVSNYVKKILIDEAFVPENKVVVIHNGVDPEKFYKFEKLSSIGIKLIYVGRIVKEKGVFDLVKSFGSVSELDVVLNIYGDGQDFAELKQLVKDRGLESKIFLHGNVPNEVALKAMVTSDIFVFPTSRVEGFPMTLVEAMFAGLPIVATDIGGNSDAIINGETGFLSPAGDFGVFVKNLTKLITDASLRAKMSEKAKERAVLLFGIDVMIKKYEQVIEEVLKK